MQMRQRLSRSVKSVVSVPPFEVVGGAPGGGAVTAGDHAAAVSVVEGDPLVAAGQAVAAAEVQGAAVVVDGKG